jgi:hypothetical protein
MSVNYRVKIGPYIEVFNPELPSTKEHYGCNNPKCKVFQKLNANKFCSQCGSPIALVSIPCKARIKFDFNDEFSGRLYEIHHDNLPNDKYRYSILQPNTGQFGDSFGDYESVVIELTTQISELQLRTFNETFAKEIIKLNEVFGENNVKVKWGVIAYAS